MFSVSCFPSPPCVLAGAHFCGSWPKGMFWSCQQGRRPGPAGQSPDERRSVPLSLVTVLRSREELPRLDSAPPPRPHSRVLSCSRQPGHCRGPGGEAARVWAPVSAPGAWWWEATSLWISHLGPRLRSVTWTLRHVLASLVFMTLSICPSVFSVACHRM